MIIIRKLVLGDEYLFLQLINILSSARDGNKIDFPSVAYLRERLSENNFHVLVAIKDNNVVGGLTAFELKMYKREKIEMFLFEIEVAQDHRQQGIATQLIQELKNLCTHQDIREMFVLTLPENNPANQLYKNTGAKSPETNNLYSYILE